MYLLHGGVRGLGNVGWATFSKLYVSVVRNMLLYRCEIWGGLCSNAAKMERVQRAAITKEVFWKYTILSDYLGLNWRQA